MQCREANSTTISLYRSSEMGGEDGVWLLLGVDGVAGKICPNKEVAAVGAGFMRTFVGKDLFRRPELVPWSSASMIGVKIVQAEEAGEQNHGQKI